MTAADAFPHRFRGGAEGSPVLLALHGTGGDEASLLDLAAAVAPGWPVLSPRGPVREGAWKRWFRRFGEGVFDLGDLRRRAADLAAWSGPAMAAHGVSGRPLVALGHSNGANAAAALLMLHPGVLRGAVLLRAQYALEPPPGAPPARRVPVLLLSGRSDPIVPLSEARRLAVALASAGADVEHLVAGSGHGVEPGDLEAAIEFLGRRFPAGRSAAGRSGTGRHDPPLGTGGTLAADGAAGRGTRR